MELRRLRTAAVATLVAPAAMAAGFGSAVGPADADAGATTSVIVGYSGTPAAAERAIVTAGGSIHQELAVAEAITASVPEAALSRLAGAPGVREITVDGAVDLKAKKWIADDGATPMAAVNQMIGTPGVWTTKDSSGRTVTGKGIGVALIDSGVTPVAGLSDPSRIINGPDLSFESQAPNLHNLDTFGHGTHMAGIILGRDPDVVAGKENEPGHFVGVAPDANLINIKVAAADGAVDVSQVIAAIDWAVSHRNDPGLNIRVLNLTFGTDSLQDPKYDPLSHAVEAAWRSGIVVVVAAGNDGTAATRLGMPAMNPYIIAVGAADHENSADVKDDLVASFSSRGSTTRHPDLLAPGRSVVSLRDPNSYIDTQYPVARLDTTTDPTQRYFRGSGTSQATAVVSGAAALLLQQRPSLTPDQVKKLLVSTAVHLGKADTVGQGAGELNLKAASTAAIPAATVAAQGFGSDLGTGSLEQSRGTAHVVDPDNGIELIGEFDIMGHPFKSATWGPLSSAGTAWTGGRWNSSQWTGTDWSGTSNWSSRTWAGATWNGTSWSSRTWASRSWAGATWTGSAWSSSTWTGRTWAGRTWAGNYWSGAIWK